MDTVNSEPHWVFRFPLATRNPQSNEAPPLAGEEVVTMVTFILTPGSTLYPLFPFFHPLISFLGQGFLGLPTPFLFFSYDLVSKSPNHLETRMCPLCPPSPPDTGLGACLSLRSFIQVAGREGQGWGWGRGSGGGGSPLLPAQLALP